MRQQFDLESQPLAQAQERFRSWVENDIHIHVSGKDIRARN
jgi:hypothetical protein